MRAAPRDLVQFQDLVQPAQVDGHDAVVALGGLHAADHGTAAAVGYGRVPPAGAPVQQGRHVVLIVGVGYHVGRVGKLQVKGPDPVLIIAAIGVDRPVVGVGGAEGGQGARERQCEAGAGPGRCWPAPEARRWTRRTWQTWRRPSPDAAPRWVRPDSIPQAQKLLLGIAYPFSFSAGMSESTSCGNRLPVIGGYDTPVSAAGQGGSSRGTGRVGEPSPPATGYSGLRRNDASQGATSRQF